MYFLYAYDNMKSYILKKPTFSLCKIEIYTFGRKGGMHLDIALAGQQEPATLDRNEEYKTRKKR